MAEPIKNRAFSFKVALVSQADTKKNQVYPTLAPGDVQVQKDGGGWANIGTLPTVVAGSESVTVSLTSTELNCADLEVRFKDAAGAEWCDLMVTLKPRDFSRPNFPFFMRLLDGNPATGKAITATRKIDGGAFGAGTIGSVTEIGSGWYSVNLPHDDCNGRSVALMFTEASCTPTPYTIDNQL